MYLKNGQTFLVVIHLSIQGYHINSSMFYLAIRIVFSIYLLAIKPLATLPPPTPDVAVDVEGLGSLDVAAEVAASRA